MIEEYILGQYDRILWCITNTIWDMGIRFTKRWIEIRFDRENDGEPQCFGVFPDKPLSKRYPRMATLWKSKMAMEHPIEMEVFMKTSPISMVHFPASHV